MTRARPYLIVLAFVAVMVQWLQWLQWTAATQPIAGSLMGQEAPVAGPPVPRRDGVFAIQATSTAPSVPTHIARPAVSVTVNPMPAPAPAPFAFLGRYTDHGQSAVMLYGGGRTLKVSGTGPVADDYEVDALLANLVVLRHVPSGTQQLIELTARQSLPLSPLLEDFPAD